MATTINLGYLPNGATPIYDQDNKLGERVDGGGGGGGGAEMRCVV